MATIKINYQGQLRTEMTHLQSGKKLITDAPTDNHGKGESFSPTDMVAGALCSCMLTIIGIAAENHNFSIDGAEATVTKIMQKEPRRIGEVIVDICFPKKYTDKEKRIIEKAALSCPVHHSLHPDVKKTINFNYI
ncbi:MAG: OsmC family protein [Bacteroidales bacterium]